MSRRDDPKDSSIPQHLRALFASDNADADEPDLKGLLPDTDSAGLRTGRVGRAFQLSKLAVGGGSRWLMGKARNLVANEESAASRDQETGMALATQMLKTFSQMRGVAMKMGQMLSYMDNFLPPEAQKVLTLLQRDAPPMEWSVIREQIEAELGQAPESVFADFQTQPLAAASIGQVHRATLPDGTDVAVKIQYPGIEKAMRSDLKNTKILGLFQKMLFFRTDAKAIMQELETRFLDECDYTKEADYQEQFYRRFQGHPGIVVPRVFRDYSTRRILTTEFQEGRGFYEWLADNPSDETRQVITHHMYRFYLGSLYLDGLFNCDPHPGNYIFRDDGRVAFLDYGCCRPFPSERRHLWTNLAQTVMHAQWDDLEPLAIAIGFFNEGQSYDRDAFIDLMQYLYRPYLNDEPFDFQDQHPETTFRRMFLDNPNLFKLNMPFDAVFLNRIGFGLVSILAEVGSSLNCRQHLTSYLSGVDPDWPNDPLLSPS